MRTIQKLVAFMWPHKSQVLLSILLSVLTIGASISLMSTSAFLISMAALHPSVSEVSVAVVGVRFFGISRGIFRYMERLVSHSTSFKVLANIRVWLYSVIEPKAPAGITDFKSGDLLNRIIADVDNLENFFVRVFLPPVTSLIIITAVSFFMSMFSPAISLILFTGLLTIGVGISGATLRISNKPGAYLTDLRSKLREEMVDFVQGLPDIISFGQQKVFTGKIEATTAEYYSTQQKLGLINSFQAAATSLVTGSVIWVILFIAIPLVNNGQIKGVHLAVVLLGSMASFEAVQNLPQAMNLLGANLRSAARLFELEAIPNLIIEPVTPKAIPSLMDLKFSDLRFSYGDTEVLKGIDLDLPAGKKLAIVGKSGAGKTTLTNLLFRFWEPRSGEILLHNTQIQNFTTYELRKVFSLVSQSTYLFNTSIKENLRIANHKASDAEIEAACKAAEIHQFIINLPKGYNTIIGERGTQISGGERQRLSIARALLKDAPILILDEPTSNLDPLTEAKIIDTITNVFTQKSVLWITHRLIGLEKMDGIVVMEDGLVVEQGKHAELLKAKGEYFHLWCNQQF